jgi:type III pantothenate kinase
MKNLVIDFGNTNKKLAVFDEGKLVSVDQYSSVNLMRFRELIRTNPGIDNCILSSVIPFREEIKHFLSGKFHFYELDDITPLPIINRYRSKKTLGRDRLAAAVAGASKFPGKNVLIINTGTCITYDFINGQNEYIGGAISPGIVMRFHALHTFTGKLPLVSFRNNMILTGKNTEESILSGVLTGAIAEIEGIAERYQQKYPDLNIILSGGDHKYFDKRLKISIFALPNIVIHGLQQILAFNVNKTK